MNATCDKKFSYEAALKLHEKENHSNGPIKCNQCSVEVKNKIELSKHMLEIHKGVKLTYCNCCEKYISVLCLAKHFRKCHTNEPKEKLLQLYQHNGPYKCKTCAKEYENPNSLYLHEREKHESKNPQSKL